MTVHIRPATPGDSADAVRVVRAVFDEYGFIWEPDGYHADLYDLEAHYLDRGHGFWVGIDGDGGVVGTVALERFAPLPGEPGEPITIDSVRRVGGCDCSLQRLYVAPSARRDGAGTALLCAALDGARSERRRLLEIWSDKRFADAHRLYERVGARTVAERISTDPDESAEWGLVLSLER